MFHTEASRVALLGKKRHDGSMCNSNIQSYQFLFCFLQVSLDHYGLLVSLKGFTWSITCAPEGQMWTWTHDVSSCTVGELACAEQKVDLKGSRWNMIAHNLGPLKWFLKHSSGS